MANEKVSKVIYGGTTLIDLTGDTVDAAHLLYGYTAHGADGEEVTGSCNYTANPSDGNASVSEVLSGKTFYAGNATKKTGEMTNRGGVTGTISTKAGEYTIQSGYHDGSGKVSIHSDEQAKIIDTNIKSGVTILGVTGSYTGESVTAEAKTATPSTSQQVILPSSGYDYLSQVTVNAIPYTETVNTAGGLTVTIG